MIEHPDLQIKLVSPEDVFHRDGLRAPEQIGAYEWWRFEAIDPDTRSGCIVTFYNGYAYSPHYRRLVNRYYEGLAVDEDSLRPAAHPALSIVLFRDGKPWRRSNLIYPPGSLRFRQSPFRLTLGHNSVKVQDGKWIVSVIGTPWSIGLAGPQLHSDEEISINLEFRPLLNSPLLERAYLPVPRRFSSQISQLAAELLEDQDAEESVSESQEYDGDLSATPVQAEPPSEDQGALPVTEDTSSSPTATAGTENISPDQEETEESDQEKSRDTLRVKPPAEHRWLLACPTAEVRGSITVEARKGGGTLEFESASGYHDHVWGSSLLGEGYHSRYATRLNWPDGALVCDLPMYARYVQVAATFILFSENEPPRVYRGERTRLTSTQFTTWLMSQAKQMKWREVKKTVQMHQEAVAVIDSTPYSVRSLATVDLSYKLQQSEQGNGSVSPVGTRSVRGMGVTQFEVFSRLDHPLLSRLTDRCLFTLPAAPDH